MSYKNDFSPPNVLVGRTRELSQLREWRQRESSATLVITGPAGIGKTALVNAFLNDVPSEEWLMIDPLEQDLPLPLVPLLVVDGWDGDLSDKATADDLVRILRPRDHQGLSSIVTARDIDGLLDVLSGTMVSSIRLGRLEAESSHQLLMEFLDQSRLSSSAMTELVTLSYGNPAAIRLLASLLASKSQSRAEEVAVRLLEWALTHADTTIPHSSWTSLALMAATALLERDPSAGRLTRVVDWSGSRDAGEVSRRRRWSLARGLGALGYDEAESKLLAVEARRDLLQACEIDLRRASALSGSGATRRAQEVLAAVERRASEEGLHSTDLLEIRIALALTRANEDDSAASIPELRDVLEPTLRTYGPASMEARRVGTALAGAYRRMGNLADASTVLELILAEGTTGRTDPRLALDLASCRLEMGDAHRAVGILERTLRDALNLDDVDDQTLVQSSSVLGRAYAAIGDYDRGIPLLEESLRRLRSQGTAIDEVGVAFPLATLLLQRGDAHRSITLLEGALTRAASAEGDPEILALASALLVESYLAAGERDRARSISNTMVRQFSDQLPADSPVRETLRRQQQALRTGRSALIADTAVCVYLVLDTSGSMAGRPIHALNASLQSLLVDLRRSPLTADRVWISVLQYSTSACVALALTNTENVQEMPRLDASGVTNYGPALTLLRSEIQSDVSHLKSRGLRVLRPLVFFVSDGLPTDQGWEATLNRLNEGFRYAPRIVAIGLGDADADSLRRVANSGAFMLAKKWDLARSFEETMSLIASTITRASSSSNFTGSNAMQVVDVRPGIERISD